MYAQLMLDELRKVIPSFLVRVDRPERGGAWSSTSPRPATTRTSRRRPPLRRRAPGTAPTRSASSTGTPTARTRCSPRSATRTPACPKRSCSSACARLSADDRVALMRAYVGERDNRRHKPGRAFERTELPLRRAGRLRRVPRPATPPHADDRMAAAHTAPRLRDARAGARGRARAPLRRSDGAIGRTLRRARRAVPRAGCVRGVARVPHALRHADERA